MKPQILGFVSSAFEVTESSLPHLYKTYRETCETLGFVEPPPLYIEDAHGTLEAYTNGADNPYIVISNRLVSSLFDDELRFVLGHELGHISSGHVKYNALLDSLIDIGFDIASVIPIIGQLGMAGVRTTLLPALRAWSRCAEYTSDRAGLLACQNEESVWRAMLKVMGYPKEYYGGLNGRALLNQALRFEERLKDSKIERALEFGSILYGTHPRWVHRALELYKWVREGHMAEIVDASPEGRKKMAEAVSRDPQQHAFLTAVNKELIDWAAGEFDVTRRHCAPLVRGMTIQGRHPKGSPLASIMQIELSIQKIGGEVKYVAYILVNREGQPVRVSFELPWGESWDSAPDEVRSEFIRNNQDTISRVLYSIANGR